MRPQILLDYVITPVLERMGSRYDTLASRQLLLATSAQESHCGYYGKQVKGPALGLFQMEPDTLNDLFDNYLYYNFSKKTTVEKFNISVVTDKIELVGNNYYATALARMQYWRDAYPMPEYNDFDAMWLFYKRVWNTHLGAATEEEFRANWDKYVAPVIF
ncbi:hypothetical protein GD1_18 [Paraglaciecola Antarctic GD virus 1]|nr:hypothetical protein GD1_18 [Paraglaciecola Antarctic GD virus 1]